MGKSKDGIEGFERVAISPAPTQGNPLLALTLGPLTPSP